MNPIIRSYKSGKFFLVRVYIKNDKCTAFDEDKKVTRCVIQAVYSNNEYEINWRDLKQPTLWRQGWC